MNVVFWVFFVVCMVVEDGVYGFFEFDVCYFVLV